MADPKESYSKDEHVAILADRVAQETASITAERDGLKTERDDLASKLDVADSAKLAAEQRAEKAEQDLAAFKTEVEEREAASARKDSRVAELKDKAPHLDEKWFEAEGRVERITAMKDEDFAQYVGDMSAAAPAGETPPKREVPRETAMSGTKVDDDAPKSGAARGFLLRNYQSQEA